MSSAIDAAIYDRLTADAILAAYLSTYAGAPAVITQRFVPGDVKMPYCHVGEPATIERTSTWGRAEVAADVDIDVRLFAVGGGDDVALSDAADRIVALLNRVDLPVAGYGRAIPRVINGPLDLSADTDADGRLVTIRIHLAR